MPAREAGCVRKSRAARMRQQRNRHAKPPAAHHNVFVEVRLHRSTALLEPVLVEQGFLAAVPMPHGRLVLVPLSSRTHFRELIEGVGDFAAHYLCAALSVLARHLLHDTAHIPVVFVILLSG